MMGLCQSTDNQYDTVHDLRHRRSGGGKRFGFSACRGCGTASLPPLRRRAGMMIARSVARPPADRRVRGHTGLMRRRLIALRHAKSDWSGGVADHDRPLAGRGRREAALAGRWLRENAADIDLVVFHRPNVPGRPGSSWPSSSTTFPRHASMIVCTRPRYAVCWRSSASSPNPLARCCSSDTIPAWKSWSPTWAGSDGR